MATLSLVPLDWKGPDEIYINAYAVCPITGAEFVIPYEEGKYWVSTKEALPPGMDTLDEAKAYYENYRAQKILPHVVVN